MPASAFPLPDPEMLEIKLGQLLAFSAGIRGNNPSYVYGEEKIIDPPGLDVWPGMVDSYVVGKKNTIGTERLTLPSLSGRLREVAILTPRLRSTWFQ